MSAGSPLAQGAPSNEDWLEGILPSDVTKCRFRVDSKGKDAVARRPIPSHRCAATGLDTRSESEETMNHDDKDRLREEYDFSGGVGGKHHEAYRKGTNVVFLDRDVAEVFKDSAAVNRALRAIAQVARDHAGSIASR